MFSGSKMCWCGGQTLVRTQGVAIIYRKMNCHSRFIPIFAFCFTHILAFMKTALFLSLLSLCLGCTNRHGNTAGIIGGDDGPTSIYVSNDSTTLEAYGLQLTQQMRQLAHDSCYIAYAVHAEKIKSLVESIGKQAYDKPRKVFRLRHLHTQKADELLSQSSATKPIIIDRLLRSIPAQLNAQGGADLLAATSLLIAEDAFLYAGLKEYTFYLYLYEGRYQSLVLYRPGKSHIVLAHASFIAHQRLEEAETAEDVKRFFAEMLEMPEVEVEELAGE